MSKEAAVMCLAKIVGDNPQLIEALEALNPSADLKEDAAEGENDDGVGEDKLDSVEDLKKLRSKKLSGMKE
jgi:hypothetical protein